MNFDFEISRVDCILFTNCQTRFNAQVSQKSHMLLTPVSGYFEISVFEISSVDCSYMRIMFSFLGTVVQN